MSLAGPGAAGSGRRAGKGPGVRGRGFSRHSFTGVHGEVLRVRLMSARQAPPKNPQRSRKPAGASGSGSVTHWKFPKTGVSMGQIEQWLRESSGSRAGVSAAVISPGRGLKLSARSGYDGMPRAPRQGWAISKHDPADSRAIYAREQPRSDHSYLSAHGRDWKGSKKGAQSADRMASSIDRATPSMGRSRCLTGGGRGRVGPDSRRASKPTQPPG